MKLIEEKKPDINLIYSDLEQHFPKTELKDKNVFEKILTIPEYKVFHIVNNGTACGYFTFLEFPDRTILIDYIAIYKNFRGKGGGSKTFDYIKEQMNYLGCYLEVEKENPDDINTTRRIRFYQKQGAQLLNMNYIYPNHQGHLPMDLYFMPFDENYFPKKEDIFNNIKLSFDKLHFDIDDREKIFTKIQINMSL